MKTFKHLVFAACITAFATMTATGNIATFSGAKITLESKAGKAIAAKIETIRKKLTKEVEELTEKITALEKETKHNQEKFKTKAGELEKSGSMLSKDAQQAKVEELQKLEMNIKDGMEDLDRLMKKRAQAAQIAEQKFMNEYQKEVGEFNQKVSKITQNYAEKHECVVLAVESTAGAHKKFDITENIIKELDKDIELKADTKK
jgi:Skp family chaperone for outer membrane proteins